MKGSAGCSAFSSSVHLHAIQKLATLAGMMLAVAVAVAVKGYVHSV